MNTIITKDFQIKLIAFGLLAIIPITINLGLSFLFPKTDWNTYRTLETEYIKNNMPNYDQYKKLKRDYNLSKKESNLFSVHKEYVTISFYNFMFFNHSSHINFNFYTYSYHSCCHYICDIIFIYFHLKLFFTGN